MKQLILIGWLLLTFIIIFSVTFVYFEYFRDRDWIPSWKQNRDLESEHINVKGNEDAKGTVMYSFKKNGTWWYRCRMKMRNGSIQTHDFIITEIQFANVEIEDRVIYVDANYTGAIELGTLEYPFKTISDAVKSIKPIVYHCEIGFDLEHGTHVWDTEAKEAMEKKRFHDASIKFEGKSIKEDTK